MNKLKKWAHDHQEILEGALVTVSIIGIAILTYAVIAKINEQTKEDVSQADYKFMTGEGYFARNPIIDYEKWKANQTRISYVDADKDAYDDKDFYEITHQNDGTLNKYGKTLI